MPEKKNKKVPFTEEDAATLSQRYDATTVCTLLQEVTHYAQPKIDWSELVKKSATGISNAREYQMLWRHLAYRHSLPEIFEDGAQPLDDDSDLECEIEALPPVSVESASEAAACVKVMIASRTLSESAPSSSTIEAPLTINVPVCHSSRIPIESSQPSDLMQGASIIFPVTVQRQTLPTVSSTDGIETKGLVGGNMASKRKRKTWSEDEDMQLRAAVQRFGEGNWATMAKGDNFPIKRSPTQLAQRWSILRKKDGSASSGTISTSTQYTTAEQLATRHSLSLALDMPFKKLTAPGMTDPVKTSMSIKNQVQIRNTTETVASSFVPPQQSCQQALLGSSDSHAKSKLADEKPVLKGNLISDHVVKSTTAASGTRIDSSSSAISQFKVAQVKSAADTKPAVNSLTKLSISTNLPSDPKNKHITPLADKVPLKQDVNPTKIAVDTKPAVSSLTRPFISTNFPSDPKNKHITPLADKVPLRQDVNPAKDAVDTKPAVSSLTKPSISTNLPLDPKNKHVTPLAAKVPLKQDVVNPTKDAVDTKPAVSSLTRPSISTNLPSDPKNKHITPLADKVPLRQDVNPAKDAVDTRPAVGSLTKPSISTNLPLDPKNKHVTPLADKVILKLDVNPTKDAVDAKPAVSSLPRPSISTNFPSDPQQNNYVTPLTDKVPLKQYVNPTKEFTVSDPSSTPKEKVQEIVPPKVTTGSQVDSNLEKGRLDIGQEKSMPLVKISSGEEISKDKANPVACEEQGSVKKATENSNLDKGSQNLDQDKKINSINENSNDHNMNDKHVNLSVQDESSRSAKVVNTDGGNVE